MSSVNGKGPEAQLRAEIENTAARLAQLLATVRPEERPALEVDCALAIRNYLTRIEREAAQVLQKLKSPLPPELREWARQLFTEEETAAGLRDLQEHGGMELHEFLPELEQIVGQP
jgi:hypothetical protein